MINYLQSNSGTDTMNRIMVISDWRTIVNNICNKSILTAHITNDILLLMQQSGCDERGIISGILKYCVDNKPELLPTCSLETLCEIMHYQKTIEKRDAIALLVGELAKNWRHAV